MGAGCTTESRNEARTREQHAAGQLRLLRIATSRNKRRTNSADEQRRRPLFTPSSTEQPRGDASAAAVVAMSYPNNGSTPRNPLGTHNSTNNNSTNNNTTNDEDDDHFGDELFEFDCNNDVWRAPDASQPQQSNTSTAAARVTPRLQQQQQHQEQPAAAASSSSPSMLVMSNTSNSNSSDTLFGSLQSRDGMALHSSGCPNSRSTSRDDSFGPHVVLPRSEPEQVKMETTSQGLFNNFQGIGTPNNN